MRSRLLLSLLSPLLLAGCFTDNAPVVLQAPEDDGVIERQSVQMPMPSGTVSDENHGKETSLHIGALAGMNGVLANGVATIHSFEDGYSLGTIQLNVAVPEDGLFYEAWLTKGGDTAGAKSLGHMTNAMNDVRHSTRFETDQPIQMYDTVVITREKDDGNTAPGEPIASGILKDRSR